MVYEHLDGTVSIGYGPHTVARFNAQGEISGTPKKAVESAAAVGIRKRRGFPHDAWKSVAQNSDAFPHFQQPPRRVSFPRDFIRVVRYAERLVLTGGKNSPVVGAHSRQLRQKPVAHCVGQTLSK